MADDDEGAASKVPGHGLVDKLKDSKHKNLYILLLTLAGVIIAYLTYRKMSTANQAAAAAATPAGTTTTSGGVGDLPLEGTPGAQGQPGASPSSAWEQNVDKQLAGLTKYSQKTRQIVQGTGKKQGKPPVKASGKPPVKPPSGLRPKAPKLTPPEKPEPKPGPSPSVSTHATAESQTTHPGGVQHKTLQAA